MVGYPHSERRDGCPSFFNQMPLRLNALSEVGVGATKPTVGFASRIPTQIDERLIEVVALLTGTDSFQCCPGNVWHIDVQDAVSWKWIP